MNVAEAIALGVLQGVTEFLPVSSSGHLVLAQKLFGITGPTLFFDTMLHVGTLAAVVAVLWKDVWGLLRRPFQPLTGYLAVALLPLVVVALLFNDSIEALFASGAFLGWAFLFTAASLTVAERLSGRRGLWRGENAVNWRDALCVGLAQAVAILPAVSRSGMTLSAALARNIERPFAARFSFLLSIPAILGAFVLQLKDLLDAGKLSKNILTAPVIVGTLTAAVVGFFSVKFMLALVRRHTLQGFAAYTAALGILVLVDQNLTHIVF